MAKHVESYLCIVCNAIVIPVHAWAGSQIAVSCPTCGRRFKVVRASPELVAAVEAKPQGATAGLFDLGGEG